jgi:MFS family permease
LEFFFWSTIFLRNIRILFGGVFCFGLCNGLVQISAPQLGLALRMSSQQQGVLGIAMPVGYVASCLLLNRLLQRWSAKHVVFCGLLGTGLSACAMSFLRSSEACMAAQTLFGLSCGAIWPFFAAWMLDFQSTDIRKSTILRFYNIAWTSGTALGMVAAGQLICRGFLTQALLLAVGCIGMSFILTSLSPATPAPVKVEGAEALPSRRHCLPFALLLAAIIANVTAQGTTIGVRVTYAELNKVQEFQADRMGIMAASMLAGILSGFLAGSLYEPFLGRRRVYCFIAASLVAVNLVLATQTRLALLLAATVLCGFVAALAFQCCIVASTEYFSTRRAGTTFHEAMVGTGHTMALYAGYLILFLRRQGVDDLSALRAPFFAMSGLVAGCLVLQVWLVSRHAEKSVLLPELQTSAPPHGVSQEPLSLVAGQADA